MPPAARCPRTAPRAGPWASASRRLAAAIAGLLLLASTARADEADDLRERIRGASDADRPALLRTLDASPALAGAVLGPLIKDAAAEALGAAAQTAAYLADRAPKDGEPLLADAVLARCDDRAEVFVPALRRYLAPDGSGWGALAAAARRRVLDGSADLSVRVGAALLLKDDSTVASARALAQAWASGSEDVRTSAADALASMLAYRFDTAAEALEFLGANGAASFSEWLRRLSARKDAPDGRLYLRMVAEARANIERADKVEALEPYLDPAETPWVEVRRAAAHRAAAVEAPGEAWVPVLRRAIEEETDRETLVALLEVTKTLKREGDGEAKRALAQAALDRLPRCCGSPELLRGLLAVLGRVGDAKAVAEAYERIRDAADDAAFETWLAAAGTAGGNELVLCRFHESRIARSEPSQVALRARALDALARSGAASWSGAAVAGAYLRGILRRDDSRPDEAKLPREPAVEARQAAVRGLEGFPSPETVVRLRELAAVPPEDPGVARLAVSVLARLAARLPQAAEALVDVAQAEDLAPVVRIEAVRDLARLASDDAPPAVREAAVVAAQLALRPGAGSRELRLAAAEAASALGDGGSLPGVAALAAEFARAGEPLPEGLQGAAERLLTALAQADATQDPAIVDGLERLAAAGGHDGAVALARAAADAGGGRLALQVLRAELLAGRARVDGREPGARRQDLADAHRVLRSIVLARRGAAPEDPRDVPLWEKALALHQAVCVALLDDPGVNNGLRRSALLAGAEVVALRQDAAAAGRAVGWVAQARAIPDLGDEERAMLDRLEKVLADLIPSGEGAKD